ncbi:MAG: MotA/TolQ/ExbB proton channel family protein [Micrococcales bacterium]|nr:MotA/TolQ/ExbB proton channel family protein [Micrococcales bacterium]
MDPSGIVGIILAIAAIFGAQFIEGGNPGSIVLPGPLILVWFGTIGAGVAGHTLADTKGSFAKVPVVLRSKAPDAGATIDTVISLADRARREGLLALEDAARDVDDAFLRSGLQAAIDGTDPEDLRMILEDKIATKRSADRVHAKYFADLGGYAPTLGIIGTVIALVHVLENLANPGELGASIATAFVATLWGLLSANVLWLPLAARMRRMSDLECAQMEVTLEGLLALQAGANPRLVGERLRSMLPPTAAKPDKNQEKAA